jgi:hypothetical protein
MFSESFRWGRSQNGIFKANSMYNAMITENIWDNRILWKLKLHKNLFVVFKGSDTHKGYPCSTKLDGEYKMCILRHGRNYLTFIF